MSFPLRYRGRDFGLAEVAAIRELIAAHPMASRRQLSLRLCEAWGWRQANGQPCEMLARGLMLALHRAGHIELPPVRVRVPNNAIVRRLPDLVAVDASPLVVSLSELGSIELRQVRRTDDEVLCDGLIAQYHFLGYKRPVGEHLKLVAWALGRPIACALWSSAPRHLAPRDRFIGWSADDRRRNLHSIAYNTRFLILPWVRVPHLASHLLGRMARLLPSEWVRVYGHAVLYLESFIDPARNRGTCYKAANWVFLGLTTGRGHNARSSRRDQPRKQVLGFPLRSDFRELLIK